MLTGADETTVAVGEPCSFVWVYVEVEETTDTSWVVLGWITIVELASTTDPCEVSCDVTTSVTVEDSNEVKEVEAAVVVVPPVLNCTWRF